MSLVRLRLNVPRGTQTPIVMEKSVFEWTREPEYPTLFAVFHAAGVEVEMEMTAAFAQRFASEIEAHLDRWERFPSLYPEKAKAATEARRWDERRRERLATKADQESD